MHPAPDQATDIVASIDGRWPVVLDPTERIPAAWITRVEVPAPGTRSYSPQGGPWQGSPLPVVAEATVEDSWLLTLVVVEPRPGESWQVAAAIVEGEDDEPRRIDLTVGDEPLPLAMRLDIGRVVRALASLARIETREGLLGRLGDLH